MAMPPILTMTLEQDYRTHFEANYCTNPILTFDGISVRFRRSDFDHCCFRSSRRDGIKDQFCTRRAERLDWITATLQDSSAELFIGWDGKRKQYDPDRRAALVNNDYLVVIRLLAQMRAKFVTAFVVDNARTLRQIRSGPKWV